MFGLIILVALIIFVGAYLIASLSSHFYGSPNVSCPQYVIKQALVEVGARPGQSLYDLGSGWGKVLSIGKRNFNLRVSGCEAVFLPYIWTRLQGFDVEMRKVSQANLSKADIIFAYLYPELIASIREKLIRAINEDKKVIVVDFKIPDLKPKKISSVRMHKIYIY